MHASTSINSDTVNLTRATTGNCGSIVNKVADEVVQLCEEKNISDPVEILRCLQQHMVTGRQREVENISEANEGDTSYILVDHSNILQTAFDDRSSLEDLRLWKLISIIIHQTHYEISDWSRAFNQFTIACELDMINVISATDNTFIMSSSTSA